MKRLMRVSAALFVALSAFVGFTTPAYAIANPDAIAILNHKVFQNVFETGDMLFIAEIKVTYAAPPTQLAKDAFNFSVYHDSDIQQSTPITAYQYSVISIYANPTTVTAKYTWGHTYALVLSGSPTLFASIVEGTNKYSVNVSYGDYIPYTTSAENKALIKTYLLDLANDLEIKLSTTLTQVTASGEVLNAAGRTMFVAGIPGIESAIPSLFQFSLGDNPVEWDTHPGTLGTELTISSKLGGTVNAAFTGLGTFFGVSGQMVGGFFAVIIAMFVFGIVFAYTGSSISGMILCLPIVIFASWAGLIPLYILYVATLLVVMYVFYHLWLQGAG